MAIFNSKLFVYHRVQSMMFLVSRRVYEFSLHLLGKVSPHLRFGESLGCWLIFHWVYTTIFGLHIFIIVAEIPADCEQQFPFLFVQSQLIFFADLQVFVGQIHIVHDISWVDSLFEILVYEFSNFFPSPLGARMGLFSAQVEGWGASPRAELLMCKKKRQEHRDFTWFQRLLRCLNHGWLNLHHGWLNKHDHYLVLT